MSNSCSYFFKKTIDINICSCYNIIVGRVIRMELIKNNKGVIIFYLLIIVAAFLLKFNNDKNLEVDNSELIVYNDFF